MPLDLGDFVPSFVLLPRLESRFQFDFRQKRQGTVSTEAGDLLVAKYAQRRGLRRDGDDLQGRNTGNDWGKSIVKFNSSDFTVSVQFTQAKVVESFLEKLRVIFTEQLYPDKLSAFGIELPEFAFEDEFTQTLALQEQPVQERTVS